jgi:hypothetical protein
MHRDGTTGANKANSLRRLLGVEMARTNVRPPTSHRHQRDIDMSDVRKSKLDTRVAGIPTSP